MRIVASRVEQARYAVGVTRADLLPQASYEGGGAARTVLQPVRQRQRHRQPVPRRLPDGVGDRHLGPHPPRDRSVAGRSVRHRGRAARRHPLAGQRRGAGLLRAARAGSRAGDRPAHERRRSSRPSICSRASCSGGVGNKLATSRAEAALASTAGDHPGSRAPDRRQGEPDQHPARPQPRTDRARRGVDGAEPIRRTCRPDCRRRCSSGVRTFCRRSRTSWRRTPWSASPSPTSSRASA